MSKNRKQQKNKNQMELYDRFGRKPESATAGGIGKAQIPGVELLSRLERQRTLSTRVVSLLETALVRRNVCRVGGDGGFIIRLLPD
ncbi:MAG: hypothetical protein PVH88_25445 [Ignavibacteria bacterium]|jgi:hypothetical protein